MVTPSTGSYHQLGTTNSPNGSRINCLRPWRMYKLICITLLLLILTPIISFYYLQSVRPTKLVYSHHVPIINAIYSLQVDSDTSSYITHKSRSQLNAYEDLNLLKASDLKLRIDEMLRIKVIVLNL